SGVTTRILLKFTKITPSGFSATVSRNLARRSAASDRSRRSGPDASIETKASLLGESVDPPTALVISIAVVTAEAPRHKDRRQRQEDSRTHARSFDASIHCTARWAL